MKPGAGPLLHADFVALLFVQLAIGYAFATFFLLPKFLVEELHASPTEVGLVSAGFGFAGMCAMPFVGRLLDRGGEKRALLLGSALLSAAALLFTFVQDAGPLPFLLRLVQGVGITMVVNGGNLIVTRQAPAGRLAESIGLFASASLIMNAVAPSVAELVAARHGYRAAFLLAAAAGVLALLLSLRVRDPEPQSARSDVSITAILRRASSQRMALIMMSSGLGFGVMFTFGTPFALTLEVDSVRGFFVAFACAAAFVRMCLSRAIDAAGPRRVARLFLLLYGVSVLSMAWLEPNRLLALGAFFGFAHGVFQPAFTAFKITETAEHERGRVLTLLNASFGLGNALVMFLGALVEHYGYRTLFALTGGLICFAPLLFTRSLPTEPELPLMATDSQARSAVASSR